MFVLQLHVPTVYGIIKLDIILWYVCGCMHAEVYEAALNNIYEVTSCSYALYIYSVVQ